MAVSKEKTLKEQMAYFILKELIFLTVTGVLSVAFYLVLVNWGLIILPNNADEVIQKNHAQLINSQVDYTRYLPTTAQYALFSADNEFIAGNIPVEEIKYVAQLKEETTVIGYRSYRILPRDKQRLIIVHDVMPKLNMQKLGYPNIQILFFAVDFIAFIVFTLAQTYQLLNNWKIFFVNIMKTVENIKNKNLDFVLPSSDVKEFNDAFGAITKMKDSLAHSLQMQWQAEAVKTRQLSALTHDLKIPLMIIRGNAELLTDDIKDPVLLDMLQEIIEAERHIENYLEEIMWLVQTRSTEKLNKKLISTKCFIDNLEKLIAPFTKTHQVEMEFKLKHTGNLLIDVELMNRAILNVLLNAIEHAQTNVFVEMNRTAQAITIMIQDDGMGFDELTLEHATEFLYRGDHSREQDGHFGIGLAFANEVMIKHLGCLFIRNGDERGALVTLEIPFEQ